MKVVLLVLAGIVAVSFAASRAPRWFELDDYSFEQYLEHFNKKYEGEEYTVRKNLFEAKLNDIRRHNVDNSKSWKKGINHMSDWSLEQFNKLLGYRKELSFLTRNRSALIEPETFAKNVNALPKHVDWRDAKVVSDVKDQGQCGSCWSFATAESIESAYALKTGILPVLSEQQVLDCTPNPNQCGGTGGCGGGTAELAYARIMILGGLGSEWMYPYTSWYGSNYQCQNSHISPVAVLSGYKVLPPNQYSPVLTALATVGPLAIAVDASSWSDYETGVYDGCNQTSPDIDHVVQLVGYGTDPTHGDYWIVRNSWTPSWGEKGFIRLRRESTPRCGIDTHPSDGTGCNGGPSSVKVCGTCGILYDVCYPTIK